MLKTKVKVGSVTNLSEARYCAGMGVDFLSFPIPKVDPKTYQEITGWVAGPKFGIEILPNTAEHLDQYPVDFIYMSCDTIDRAPSATKLIVSLEPDQWEIQKEKIVAVKNQILFLEFVVPAIDASTESIVKKVSNQFDVFVNLPSLSELDRVLQLPIAGVSLEGSAEVRAGLKEYPLADVLERLEDD